MYETYVRYPRQVVNDPLHRIETATAPNSHDVTDFDTVKRHLRATGIEDDQLIKECLDSAVNEAEERTRRTLRPSVTSTYHMRWWCRTYRIHYPPLQSVTSVKYYDIDNSLQTVTQSGNYQTNTSTRGQGVIQFDADYVFPNLNDDIPDPIQIELVRGFAAADIPPTAKVAIRLLCEANFDSENAEKLRTEAFRILQPLVFRG